MAGAVLSFDFENGALPANSYSVGNYAPASAPDLAGSGLFNGAGALRSPAGGSRGLVVQSPYYANGGLAFRTGMTVDAGLTFTLSAAIGHALDGADSSHWSLQLWAGNAGGDDALAVFLGQQFGTNATATNADAGEWAENSVTAAAADLASISGQGRQVVVLLNTYAAGSTSYYDNVTIFDSLGAATELPEPSSLLMLSAFVAAVLLWTRTWWARQGLNL